MNTFDIFTLDAFIREQKSNIENSRIVKIQQPTRTEFILFLRNQKETKQLYININPQFYHMCFINKNTYEKRLISIPKQPPMFCMLLRKHIENSKIIKFKQVENERIAELYIQSYNEIGQDISLCLAIELMGKHSNVILYNTDTGLILGCAHNVGAEKSRAREVYGGIPYSYPPVAKSNFGTFKSLINEISQDNYKDINELIDEYYSNLIYKTCFNAKKSNLASIVNKNLKKLHNTIKNLKVQQQKDLNYDSYRLQADLLMANLYNLTDYTNYAQVYDYENDKDLTIHLDNTKTIKENATKYYKKYNKSKIAKNKTDEIISNYENKKFYSEQLLYFIDNAKNIKELEDIGNEIGEKNQNTKKVSTKHSIETITIDDNTKIYIGKNNRQNDYIISKISSDEDIWFHVHNCAGSHILLKTNNLTQELILKCAKLAKTYSSAKNSTKTGVIYTKRKYLKKPPNAPLGYVIYKNETEIMIN